MQSKQAVDLLPASMGLAHRNSVREAFSMMNCRSAWSGLRATVTMGARCEHARFEKGSAKRELSMLTSTDSGRYQQRITSSG